MINLWCYIPNSVTFNICFEVIVDNGKLEMAIVSYVNLNSLNLTYMFLVDNL